MNRFTDTKHKKSKFKLSLLIILSIFLLSLYTINQKNRSIKIRYEIATLEKQNRNMVKDSNSIAIAYFKNSSMLKLQKVAMNNGLIYYNGETILAKKRAPYKPMMLALSKSNNSDQ